MNLTDYLDPVELEKPDEYYLQSDELFGRNITIYTDSDEPGDLTGFDLALLGLPEDRNSQNRGAALAPNAIRSELYKLINPEKKIKIIDLGNVKAGNTYNDSYFAVKEVVYQLLCANLTIVVLGGSQDLTLPVYQAFENYQERINLIVVDSKIDSQKNALNTNSDSFLLELLIKKRKLFRFAHLGHQTYLTERHNIELINKLFHDTVRLGELREDIKKFEPFLRDSDFISFDMGAIRQSDAPGNFRPTPNGLYSEEGCQISGYAGSGDQVRAFGIFEANPTLDKNNQTSGLAAQMIWHFIVGFSYRRIEHPTQESPNFKSFIVGHTDLDYDMTFYKSLITDRWWIEIPVSGKEKKLLVSCSHNDYLTASNHEVPDIWWKTYQKLG